MIKCPPRPHIAQGEHKIRITSTGRTTCKIEVDGEDVSQCCTGYTVSQDAGCPPIVTLTYVYAGSIDIDGVALTDRISTATIPGG